MIRRRQTSTQRKVCQSKYQSIISPFHTTEFCQDTHVEGSHTWCNTVFSNITKEWKQIANIIYAANITEKGGKGHVEQLQVKRHRVPHFSTLVLTPESEAWLQTKDQNDVRDTAYTRETNPNAERDSRFTSNNTCIRPTTCQEQLEKSDKTQRHNWV